MIDWLNIELPLLHTPVKQGRRFVVDHDGVITSDFVMGRGVENDETPEGSYSSKIMVASVDTPYTVEACTGNRQTGVHASGLSFRGNPTKFLQGHNVFGLDCIKTLVYRMVEKVLPQLQFDAFTVRRALRLVEQWQFQVTKIDITHMFDLGSDADVNAYLRMLPFTASDRGDRAEFCKNTWYSGKHSTLWSLKMYNKYRELQSRNKAHQLPKHLWDTGIEEFALGKLRAELVLQKKALVRMGMTCPQKLQQSLFDIYEEHVGRITMKEQKISEHDVIKLPATVQATFARWKRGEDLKSVYGNDTYYRHRRILLQYGIDIKKPPIPEEERIAVVRPLKVLKPRMVTDIPQELQRYLVQKVA